MGVARYAGEREFGEPLEPDVSLKSILPVAFATELDVSVANGFPPIGESLVVPDIAGAEARRHGLFPAVPGLLNGRASALFEGRLLRQD